MVCLSDYRNEWDCRELALRVLVVSSRSLKVPDFALLSMIRLTVQGSIDSCACVEVCQCLKGRSCEAKEESD